MVFEEAVGFPLTRSGLKGLRIRAVRRGVWFRVLSRVERSLVNAVIGTVELVRSSVLVRFMTLVVEKLSCVLGFRVAHCIRTVGFPLAHELSRIAQGWGNSLAVRWGTDFGFARFLAVSHLNSLNLER